MNTSPVSRNIKLVLAYNGANYHGWQRQAEGFDTIQQRLEQALMMVVKHPLVVSGAGRTDSGVHALGQVANFHTTNLSIPLLGLMQAVNSRLPADIVVRSACQVDDSFHASRSAIGKTYRYRICLSPTRQVDRTGLVYHYWRNLDVDRMRQASWRFIGRHDFRGLASSADKRENTVRTIFRCESAPVGDEIHITVQGDGFLHKMVRNLTGTLLEIGRGRWTIEQVDRLLASRDRRDAGPTLPPDGLYMVCVHYQPGELSSWQAARSP